MRVCVSSPPPFPATFQSFLPCGEKKVGGGRPSRGGGKEATTTWTATTTTTAAGREIVSWCRVYVGRFYRERVTRLYEWLYTFVTASSKHREKGIFFFFFVDIRFEMEKGAFQGLLLFFLFFFKREVRVERLKGGSWKKFLPKNFLTMRIIRSSSLSFFFFFFRFDVARLGRKDLVFLLDSIYFSKGKRRVR